VNPDTLIVVCGYAGDLNQIENNMPCYVHHGRPVVVMSPTDSPITKTFGPKVENLSAGLKGWIGPQTLERQRLMLAAMLDYPCNHFLINDADSLCLSPELPAYLYADPDLVWSNEVMDTNPGESLLPKIAMQPPYFLSRKTIRALLRVADGPLPTSYTRGRSPEGWPLPHPTQCIDHYMLQLACGANTGHFSFHTGASFETSSEHGLSTMSNLVRAHGRLLLHQVKSADVLRQLMKDRAEYVKTHR
jgi:hypothetical protein